MMPPRPESRYVAVCGPGAQAAGVPGSPYALPESCMLIDRASGITSQLNDPRIDSPLNAMYESGAPSGWLRVGYVETRNPKVPMTMPLYLRQYGGRSRVDYRVVDSNGIALNALTNVREKASGDVVHISPYGEYTIVLYDT
jgi:hypothetical protein